MNQWIIYDRLHRRFCAIFFTKVGKEKNHGSHDPIKKFNWKLQCKHKKIHLISHLIIIILNTVIFLWSNCYVRILLTPFQVIEFTYCCLLFKLMLFFFIYPHQSFADHSRLSKPCYSLQNNVEIDSDYRYHKKTNSNLKYIYTVLCSKFPFCATVLRLIVIKKCDPKQKRRTNVIVPDRGAPKTSVRSGEHSDYAHTFIFAHQSCDRPSEKNVSQQQNKNVEPTSGVRDRGPKTRVSDLEHRLRNRRRTPTAEIAVSTVMSCPLPQVH